MFNISVGFIKYYFRFNNIMTKEEKEMLKKSVETSLKQNKLVHNMLHDL